MKRPSEQFRRIPGRESEETKTPSEKETKSTEERETSSELEPITEDETSVSYLGVKLEKAENKESEFVPQKEQ
ncbi:MAG: hypothetical protein HQ539_00005, partial [Parcubacteria group bacterium]|nr:hypothetical protein [Parcubacteria group bacterium]